MLAIIVIFVGVLLDQLTKMWAVDNLIGNSMEVIPGIINFTYAENTGAAFGIFQDATWILALVSFVLAVVMSVFLFKTMNTYGKNKYGKIYVVSLAMIISGALGNLIDRVFLGYVVDFLQFDFISFPVFNVADSFVSVGAVFLGIYWLFLMGKAEKEAALQQEQEINATNSGETDAQDMNIEDTQDSEPENNSEDEHVLSEDKAKM